MFGKISKNTACSESSDGEFSDFTEDQESVSKADSKRCTIIAKDTIINGNIKVSVDIHIHGEVIGNINTQEGSIRVMQSGHVNGELTAPTIIIDGQVDGVCCGKTIDILEHGKLKGISRCENLSIKQGGTFIGQSEKTDEVVKDNGKVTKFVSPNSIENTKSAKEIAMNNTNAQNLSAQTAKK